MFRIFLLVANSDRSVYGNCHKRKDWQLQYCYHFVAKSMSINYASCNLLSSSKSQQKEDIWPIKV